MTKPPYDTTPYVEPSEYSLRAIGKVDSSVPGGLTSAVSVRTLEAQETERVIYEATGKRPWELNIELPPGHPFAGLSKLIDEVTEEGPGEIPKLDTSPANQLPTDEDGDPSTWGQWRALEPTRIMRIKLPSGAPVELTPAAEAARKLCAKWQLGECAYYMGKPGRICSIDMVLLVAIVVLDDGGRSVRVPMKKLVKP